MYVVRQGTIDVCEGGGGATRPFPRDGSTEELLGRLKSCAAPQDLD